QAQEYADQDKQIKEKAETKNKADSLAYSSEKTLKDMAGKIDAAQKQKVEAAVKDLRESIKSDDEKDMQQKMDALTNVLHEISSKMYQESSSKKGEQQPPPPPGEEGKKKKGKKGEGAEEDIIDADYEVKD
ncbi:MAG: Hsp70 family protein, partial [Planctomycetota bacterium]